MSGARRVLGVIARVMETAGVTPDLITVLTEPEGMIPKGVDYVIHDPDDRNQIAYLSATTSGRRVYLNRRITGRGLRAAGGPVGV